MPRPLARLAGAVAAGALAAGVAPAAPAARPVLPSPAALDTAVFAGGCFWGVEAVFEHVRGVTSAVSGYTGGHAARPTYDAVSTGATGHAEAVRVVFDPSRVTYAELLDVFFTVAHDPTQRDRQGPDVGTQYRSAAFYRTPAQRRALEAHLAGLAARRAFARPVVTQVAPLGAFHEAEAYHQGYMARHPDQPYIVVHDAPKLEALRKRFPGLYRG